MVFVSSRENLPELLSQAETLVALCKQLDYQQIIAHDAKAVAALQDAIRLIRGSLPIKDEALSDYAERQSVHVAEPVVIDKAALLERRRQFVEALGRAGLADRLGKIYASGAETRLIGFRDAPHKRGLPQFDMVVGPDFSPIAGYHGIFIGTQEVFSFVLPHPADDHIWQVRERHRFNALERMVDLVSMLSAGFPVQ
jgi:hypothetical protein